MKQILCALLLVGLLIPYGASAARVDRDDLDDDIVEEVPIPVLFGVSLMDVVPDFGAPRDGGARQHEGQDFFAPGGTPIVSPTEAIVLSTGEGVSAGKYVFTANPGGETFRYMHLETIADLERGDELDVGDFIGTMGDTGNAESGSYHLHFEIRDEDNDALDPYPRLGEAFDVEDKMSFLRDILRDVPDDDEYAEFLVETFPSDFQVAFENDYRMPHVIDEAIEDAGIEEQIEAQAELEELLALIPVALATELEVGDQGPMVQLLQLYIILSSSGPARDRLLAAGATGYYGSITAAAVSEMQGDIGVTVTGVYDTRTRTELAK